MCDFAKYQRHESLKPDPAAALGLDVDSWVDRPMKLLSETLTSGKLGAALPPNGAPEIDRNATR